MKANHAVVRGRFGVGVIIVIAAIITICHHVFFQTGKPAVDTSIKLPIPDLLSEIRAEFPVANPTFSEAADIQHVGTCNIEDVNGMAYDKPMVVRDAKNVVFDGWLVDKTSKDIGEPAWIVLKDSISEKTYTAPITMRIRRSDVQDIYRGKHYYAMAGFLISLDVSRLPASDYQITIAYKGQKGFAQCDNGRHILVQHPSSNPGNKK